MEDYEAICLIVKMNPSSSLSYKEGLGFEIVGKADETFAVLDDVKVVGGATRFHLVSKGQTICYVTLK